MRIKLPMALSSIKNNSLLHMAMIALLCLIVYSNTYDSSFHFDDQSYIKNNPILRDISNLSADPGADAFPWSPNLTSSYRTRAVAYATFRLNYILHGLDVKGYHIFNNLIHLGNSLLVYLIVLNILRAWASKTKTPEPEDSNLIALFTALLFAGHPVQTQAVTYISQRFTSLAAFFYLASVLSYLKWKMSGSKKVWYAGSLVFAVLAMKTKEIAFTLPPMLAMMEFAIFEGNSKKRAGYLLPFLLTMTLVPLALMPSGETLGDILRGGTTTTDRYSRTDYLITQSTVIMRYLRLIALPTGQNLDYDWPVYRSLPALRVFLSIVFVIALLSSAIYGFLKLKGKALPLALACSGIIWFFVTLSIESSVIVTDDLIFEHRLYLPSAGLLFFFASGISNIAPRRMIAYGILAIAVIAYSVAGYERNFVWKTELSLWRDVTKKSPLKARGFINLGLAYSKSDRPDKAIAMLQKAEELDPKVAGEANYNLGVIYTNIGDVPKAISSLQKSVEKNPNFMPGRQALAYAYARGGMIQEALSEFRAVLTLDPNNSQARGFIEFLEKNKRKNY